MNNKYDVVVIGGGHNGLVNSAYLARAGKKVLVLERRHVLGGAAVTEEIIPGFKFSVCSYVVSLLRPEIIRDLDLPRHGLEILPLDGTFTPLDGDFLWRGEDHRRTKRGSRRWAVQGIRSPGTAYVLLHHYMGEIDGAFRAWGIPRGGTGGVSNAIADAARSLGAEIRTEAPVTRIAVRDGRATGVVLED